MKDWPKWTLRVLGVLDLVAALFGIFLFVMDSGHTVLIPFVHPERFADSKAPYVLQVYSANLLVDLVCALFLTLTGLSVVRLQRRALWMSNTVFIFEIGWFVLPGFGTFFLTRLGGNAQLIADSIVSAFGIGSPFTGFHLVIGYPIVALIATNIAYAKLDSAKA